MLDEASTSALRDVVWRFHAYGAYGRERAKALSALARRAPECSREELERGFEQSLAALKATVAAVRDAPKEMKPGQRFAEPGDVDTEYVLERLRAELPEVSEPILGSHVGMTIYWYYSK